MGTIDTIEQSKVAAEVSTPMASLLEVEVNAGVATPGRRHWCPV
jgi:hypothetical protein